ncbi:hypothetical protein BCR37DRAFT_388295 [Protomyces lactucae-debilis]|uniref:GDP-mannose transporter n=1 Tax=Protomyces lactucae-debilis TaxID=2754530 RepID=A0A1Y2F7N1_PROLT|nr:uncharacterized protein BCR37DRAFT_388295 [Protomyces lactucae-debilis]ORY79893.1 hypothetical protein BCR37DRAFT_388295 [Protomyces lactucae-debilis]
MFAQRTRNTFRSPVDLLHHTIAQARESLVNVQEPFRDDEDGSGRASLSDGAPMQDLSRRASLCGEQSGDDDAATDNTEVSLSDMLRQNSNESTLPFHKHDLSWERPESRQSRILRILFQPVTLLLVTSVIYAASSTMTFVLDRFILYQAMFKFPYPLVMLLAQLMACELLVLLWVGASALLTDSFPSLANTTCIANPIKYDLSMLRQLLPVSLTYLVGHVTIISCLEYVPMSLCVAFFSPMVLLALLITRAFNDEQHYDRSIALVAAIMGVGQALASLSAKSTSMSHFHPLGLLCGIIACIAIPLNVAQLKKVSPMLDFQVSQLLHCVLTTSILALLPFIMISGEIFDAYTNCPFFFELGFWAWILPNLLLAGIECISSFVLVSFTTPLTFSVLMAAKTTLVQLPIFEGLKTFGTLAGTLMTVAGLVAYLYLINQHRPKFGLIWLH